MSLVRKHSIAVAMNLFRSGNFRESDLVAQEVLTRNPRDADALHLRGVIAAMESRYSRAEELLLSAATLDERGYWIRFNLAKCLSDQGRHAEALTWQRKAIELDSNHDLGWLNLGCSLFALREFADALSAFNQALVISPQLAEAHSNRANCLFELGRGSEAIVSLDRAVSLNPCLTSAWFNRGVMLLKLGRLDEARRSFEHCLLIDRGHIDAWFNLGITLYKLQCHSAALDALDRCTELNASHPDAWLYKGLLLGESDRAKEALVCFEHTIELVPDHWEAWLNRGNSLSDLRRYSDAKASYERSIELKPESSKTWCALGNALNELLLHQDSLVSCDRAIELNPSYAEAWNNRGNALKALGSRNEALLSYQRAIVHKPDYAQAHLNLGILQLEDRDFQEGFSNYRWRCLTKGFGDNLEFASCSPVQRSCIGGHLMLLAEQGLGDEIFWAGSLSHALAAYETVTLTADIRLHSILKRAFPTVQVVDRGVAVAAVHSDAVTQIPLGDLGYLLGLEASGVKSTRSPYFLVDEGRREVIQQSACLAESTGLVCGLSWKSSNKDSGAAKSLSLRNLDCLLRLEGLSFISLQYGDVQSDIESVGGSGRREVRTVEGLNVFEDIEGLLSLIDCCDFVVTTSNVTAHLAGSIGKKGCVLVPFSKGKAWYWHVDDSVSLWYPSLNVIYQRNPFDWDDAIEELMCWLKRVRT